MQSKIDYNQRFTPCVGDRFPTGHSIQMNGIDNGEIVFTGLRTDANVMNWLVIHFFPKSHIEANLEQVKLFDKISSDMVSVVGVCGDSAEAMMPWLPKDLKQLILSDVSNDVALDCGIVNANNSYPCHAVYILDPKNEIRWCSFSEFPITYPDVVEELIATYKKAVDMQE